MRDLFARSCRDSGPAALVLSLFQLGSLSALEGHGRDELLHLVGQPLLPRLFILLQSCRDLYRRNKCCQIPAIKNTWCDYILDCYDSFIELDLMTYIGTQCVSIRSRACSFTFLYGHQMKEKEKNYIIAFVFDNIEKYLCISLSRFIF